VCECGVAVAVPALRQLRELPPAAEESSVASGPTWGLRQGAITVLMLGAVASLVAAAASRMSQQPVPTIDPVAYSENVDRLVEQMSPLQGWQRWMDTYGSLAAKGFDVYKHPEADAMQQVLDWHHWIQRIAVGLAVVGIVAAVVIGFAGRGGAKN